MADFPTAKTNAVDNVTDVLAKHINNLENKVGIDNSTDANSLDYKVGALEDRMPTGNVVGTTDTQTLTSKTLTSPVINTGVSGTAILDEDNMASNSATKLATQQSIKAYADTKIAKATNVTSIDDAGIADGEVAIFDLTNKKIKTSDKTLPTGAIVGTTDTQTLTNKTIDGNNNTLKHIIPAGSITMYGGSTAPTGYLLCDGSAVSRTTYADLFTAIGTTYGTGDGSTTFNVPNVKGKVPVGRDSGDTSFDTLGETGGEKSHTLTVTEMPSHNHSLPNYYFTADGAYNVSGSNGTGTAGGAVTGYTGGGGAHNNLQPYIVFNYIIKT